LAVSYELVKAARLVARATMSATMIAPLLIAGGRRPMLRR